MRTLWVLVFSFIFSFSTFAQWGAKGGMNISDIAGYNNVSENMISAHFGATYDYQLSKDWFFQPALLFTTIGFNLKDDKFLIKDGHVKMHALEVPFNLSFRPKVVKNIRLLTEFGLYTRYALTGNKVYEYYSDIDSPNIDESPFDAYNRFDFGFNLGLGVQQKQYYGIFSYHRGLLKAEKNVSVYHEVLRCSVGYIF